MLNIYKVCQINNWQQPLLPLRLRKGATPRRHIKRSRRNTATNKRLPLIWLLSGILAGVLISTSLFTQLNNNANPSMLSTLLANLNATNTKSTNAKNSTQRHQQVASNKQTRHDVKKSDLANITANDVNNANNVNQNTKNENNKPIFDFYTMLSRSSNDINPDAMSPINTMDNSSNQTLDLANLAHTNTLDLFNNNLHTNQSKNYYYVIQAGAFKNRADADALRAALTLNGFDTQLEIAQVADGKIWHRVIVGPFASESSAASQQRQLENQLGQSTMMLKRD